MTKLGATGEFPEGKLNDDDEGEIQFGITTDAFGNVHINFGRPVAWVAMRPEIAVEFGRLLMEHGGATVMEAPRQ